MLYRRPASSAQKLSAADGRAAQLLTAPHLLRTTRCSAAPYAQWYANRGGENAPRGEKQRTAKRKAGAANGDASRLSMTLI